MKPIAKFVMAAFAATALIPAGVMGQSTDSKNQGYLIDNQGQSAIVISGTGLCWRNSDWTPARSVEPSCGPVAAPIAAAAAAPTPAAPPPAVIAALPPPPPAKALAQKFSFSGDALFAFDKSVLKPEGKVMLDDLVGKLAGVSYDKIVTTGHTDRFGSNAYNQALSERRAHTVTDYLIVKNVQASRIEAEGKGETQPETKATDCTGPRSAKVIACLQPDRRVDVEMTGTATLVGAR